MKTPVAVEVTSLPLKQAAIVRKVRGAFGADTYRLEIHGVSVSESWIDSKERLEMLAVQINAVASGYDLFGAVTPAAASPTESDFEIIASTTASILSWLDSSGVKLTSEDAQINVGLCIKSAIDQARVAR